MTNLLPRLTECMPAWMQEARVPGAAVVWVQRSQPDHVACFGSFTWDGLVSITPNTVFQVASLSKPLFAYAALKLIESGGLDLDTPLSDLSTEPLLADEPRLPLITARRVLSHSTGLPNWGSKEKPLALRFDPGTGFGYSGAGFVYLQRVIERQLGITTEEFVQRSLIHPLGMAHTSYCWQEGFAPQAPSGHDPEGKFLEKYLWKEANAAASLYSTPAAYARFLRLMIEPEAFPAVALSSESRLAMISPQTPIDDTTAWGLGVGLKHIAGDWLFWQWGDNDGYKHLILGSIQQGCALLVLTNGENGWQVWSKVAALVFDPDETILKWLSTL